MAHSKFSLYRAQSWTRKDFGLYLPFGHLPNSKNGRVCNYATWAPRLGLTVFAPFLIVSRFGQTV